MNDLDGVATVVDVYRDECDPTPHGDTAVGAWAVIMVDGEPMEVGSIVPRRMPQVGDRVLVESGCVVAFIDKCGHRRQRRGNWP